MGRSHSKPQHEQEAACVTFMLQVPDLQAPVSTVTMRGSCTLLELGELVFGTATHWSAWNANCGEKNECYAELYLTLADLNITKAHVLLLEPTAAGMTWHGLAKLGVAPTYQPQPTSLLLRVKQQGSTAPATPLVMSSSSCSVEDIEARAAVLLGLAAVQLVEPAVVQHLRSGDCIAVIPVAAPNTTTSPALSLLEGSYASYAGQYADAMALLPRAYADLVVRRASAAVPFSISAVFGAQVSCTLQQCMDALLDPEPLDSQVGWRCSRCDKVSAAVKTLRFSRLPPCLLLQLNRFRATAAGTCEKVESCVTFPLDALKLVDDSGTTHSYVLRAVCNHFGGIGGGHYTATVRTSCSSSSHSSTWMEFDDGKYRQVSDADVQSSAAYVLCYELDVHGSAPADIQPCGLDNLGNTCYANSALQCIRALRLFAACLQSETRTSHKLLLALKSLTDASATALNSTAIIRSVAQRFPRFGRHEQQDASDFLVALLSLLHDELNRSAPLTRRAADGKVDDDESAADAWTRHVRSHNSSVAESFHSQLTSTIVCGTCGHQSSTHGVMAAVPLPIPIPISSAMTTATQPRVSVPFKPA